MISEIQTRVYAGRVRDKETLMLSSSGGAFTVLSDFFLEKGDAVVANVYNYQTNTSEFHLIQNKSERDAARGSKYMQSKPGDIFREAYQWLMLNPERNLLFVGMGCQADGFQKYAEMWYYVKKKYKLNREILFILQLTFLYNFTNCFA